MPELTPASLAVILGAAWIGMCVLISLGGWARLAARYPWPEQRGRFDGRLLRFQSVGFRRGPGYNGGVHFGTCSEGLYLSVWLPLRVGHPPIFVPWEEIESATERRAWLVRRVDLRFRREPGVELRMTTRLARRLAERSEGRFPTVSRES